MKRREPVELVGDEGKECLEVVIVRAANVLRRPIALAPAQFGAAQRIETPVGHHHGHLPEGGSIVRGGLKQEGPHLGLIEDGAEDLVVKFLIGLDVHGRFPIRSTDTLVRLITVV